MKPGVTLARIALATALASLALCLAPAARSKSIDLPPDGAQLKESPLPGYARAKQDCVGCHSAEYMLYQPPTAPRPYWDTMVKRMKTVFKAPLDDADIPILVDYLVKTYGNEQPK